ncbi:MAG: P22 coat protein - protein 5 domain protein [Oscillospiraceae bacterium]|nr:P22 coat protein - protein 5 domain protein [Oscillospiraceae bacterium]
MAIVSFIPEIWSARLLNELQKVHVAANVVNRDYEGDIKGCGSSVLINTLSGDVSVWDYESGVEIESPENLNATNCYLEIDNAKYFNFVVDDIDRAQAAGDVMDSAIKMGAYKLKDYSDADILETLANSPESDNIIAEDSPVTVTADNIYSYIAQLNMLLSTSNAPCDDRTVVLFPAVSALLIQDSKFIPADAKDERIKTGFIGRAAGMDVYESNNCYKTGSVYNLTAQSRSACTFAEQIVKMDAYRPENTFSDAVRGLYVYGVKVTESNGVALLRCVV